MDETIISLTLEELSTVLAALRYYQEQGLDVLVMDGNGWIHELAICSGDVTSLDADAIDELCERLNGGVDNLNE